MKKVAIKGISGSFHDQAALQVFGKYKPSFCYSFSEIIKSVTNGENDYGLIAIENSLVGSILDNYHLLRDNYVEIVGEIYLQIDHNLLALPGQSLEHINIVISHEMALKQCKTFLDNSSIKSRQPFTDTASAAKHIGENRIKGIASIGSIHAAKNYGLEVLSSKIQDNQLNYTRFLIVQRSGANSLASNENKATIIFSVEDEVGRLSKALELLNRKGVNLTKIESVPQPNNPGKYDMITDLELPEGSDFKRILPDLYQVVDQIKLLGIYPRSKEPWA